MKNCWEIKNCDREKGGAKVSVLGECIASKEGLGHSCWAIAGTLCGGEVQGTAAGKERSCMICDVYELYNMMTGSEGERIAQEFPEEQQKYGTILRNRMTTKPRNNFLAEAAIGRGAEFL